MGKLYPLPEIKFSIVEEENWAEAWKANYQPVRVGRHILVKPAWLDAEVTQDDVVIELDPGMAFGAGTHPSTQLCLMALEDLNPADRRILDLGCGSGILAIAAAHLGATDVLALDTDPIAVRVARENVAANSVQDRVHVELGSLDSQLHAPRRFDLVLVNILAPVIIEMCEQGLGHIVRPGGRVVAAGIIDTQADDVGRALDTAGLVVEGRREFTDWVALIARRSSS